MSEEIPWEALFQQATKVRERAHVPYSRFPVGAAVLFADGASSRAATWRTPRTG